MVRKRKKENMKDRKKEKRKRKKRKNWESEVIIQERRTKRWMKREMKERKEMGKLRSSLWKG